TDYSNHGNRNSGMTLGEKSPYGWGIEWSPSKSCYTKHDLDDAACIWYQQSHHHGSHTKKHRGQSCYKHQFFIRSIGAELLENIISHNSSSHIQGSVY